MQLIDRKLLRMIVDDLKDDFTYFCVVPSDATKPIVCPRWTQVPEELFLYCGLWRRETLCCTNDPFTLHPVGSQKTCTLLFHWNEAYSDEHEDPFIDVYHPDEDGQWKTIYNAAREYYAGLSVERAEFFTDHVGRS